MMHADAAVQNLLELRPGPLRPVVRFELVDQPLLLPVGEQLLALELLGDVPALVAVEAEHQGRRAAGFVVAFGHDLELLVEQLSPTQWNVSGTLRSSLCTSSSLRS